MQHWSRQVQDLAEAIDQCIQEAQLEELTLGALSRRMGYSRYHLTRMFRQLSGLTLRQYLRMRKLAFALVRVRDSGDALLDIALFYGFASHEAFTRAFRAAYGISPKAYRDHPRPLVLRAKLHTFDRYIMSLGEIGMIQSDNTAKAYFATLPAHTFLYIQNHDSDGYWSFWEEQDKVPGQDCDTICGLLDSIPGKLDGKDSVVGEFSGQIMARLTDGEGRRAEAYGIRLPAGSAVEAPPLIKRQVDEGMYIVFEHGPFDYEQERDTVGERLAEAMRTFVYEGTGYVPDDGAGRVSYFHFDPAQFEKRLVPVKKG